MRQKLLFLLALLVCSARAPAQDNFSGVSGLFTGDSKPPIVNLLFPRYSGVFYLADSLLVKWDASDDSFGSSPITISITTDGGLNYTVLIPELPDTDSVYVTLPLVISDYMKIKVQAQDEFGLSAFDVSVEYLWMRGLTLYNCKAYLEGPYTGTEMSGNLNVFGYIPLTQPYNVSPWLYSGTESVSAIPNPDVVDWVLIELRDAENASSASSTTCVARQAGFILKDGLITSTTGFPFVEFPVVVNQGLFMVLTHRNHLPVMSSSALPVGMNYFYSYNFSQDASQGYGGENGQKEIAAGVWGLCSGDGNGDGQVTSADKINVWKVQTGLSGYNSGDFNLDGQVDNNDKAVKWRPNVGRSSQVPG